MHNIHALPCRLNSNATSCTLDVLLLYELVTDEAMMDILPINQLRNYAMLQVSSMLALSRGVCSQHLSSQLSQVPAYRMQCSTLCVILTAV